MLRWHVVSAVFWRNVKQYFSGPLGYLFFVLFVTVCAILAFTPQFFANNLANFDQLSKYFPLLLMSIIPAITMMVWADEKRQGTDAILFTLPASDLDILLGKFLSVVAVYTMALAFSLTQVIVLAVLGDPDFGVIVTTYLGYWFAGVALLSVGMFASSLTDNPTIAYVLGWVMCSLPVLIGFYFFGWVYIEPWGFDWHLRDFTQGVIPLPSVIYFLAITVFMLYLNLIVVSKRHWNRGQQGSKGSQFTVRALALGVGLVSLVFLSQSAVSSVWSRVDLTTEKLYTLDQVTVDTLQKVKDDNRQVTIQAFVSTDVPRKFVNTKKRFVGLLREFNEFGGKNVELRFVDVKPSSEEALNAKRSGIVPQDDRSTVGGKIEETEVYLGALISTSIGDVTIPFVGDSDSLEYELSRALAATIDKKNKVTIGLLETDAFFGGPEFQGRRIPWSYNTTLQELRKQFKIKHLKPADLEKYVLGGDPTTDSDQKAAEPPSVLIVADPSSLDDAGAEQLVKYLESGHPTLMLADPLPFFWAFQNPRNLGVLNAPKMDRVSPNTPYGDLLSTSQLPKSDGGSASRVFNAIGIEWDAGATAWSVDNPHQSFSGEWPSPLGDRWPELYGPYEKAFVWARNHGDVTSFNAESPISSGLSELLMFYPGAISKAKGSELDFEPLVSLGAQSGLIPWDELTFTPKQEQQLLDPRTGTITKRTTAAKSQITSNDLVVMRSDPATIVDDDAHVLAARITGGDKGLNVVVIADLDFISDLAYQQEAALNAGNTDRAKQPIDNLAFFQNAIEVLAGNDSFVRLRNRRPKPRTLTRLERVINDFRKKTADAQEAAELEAETELKLAQESLQKANEGIQSNEQLDFFQKLQKSGQQAVDAQRRFDLKKQRLDKDLKLTMQQLKADESEQISWLESVARYLSILLAPLPALLLGAFVMLYRKIAEERGIEDDRRV